MSADKQLPAAEFASLEAEDTKDTQIEVAPIPLEQVDPAKVLLIRKNIFRAATDQFNRVTDKFKFASDMCRYSDDLEVPFTFTISHLTGLHPSAHCSGVVAFLLTNEQSASLRHRVDDPIFELVLKRWNDDLVDRGWSPTTREELKTRFQGCIYAGAKKSSDDRWEDRLVAQAEFDVSKPTPEEPSKKKAKSEQQPKCKIVDEKGNPFNWNQITADHKIPSATFQVRCAHIYENKATYMIRAIKIIVQRPPPPPVPPLDPNQDYVEISFHK